MNYTIYYNLKDQPRQDILEGIPFNIVLNTDGSELKDNDFMIDFLKWMKMSDRQVVNITTPKACDECSAWTSSRQSVYSPTTQIRNKK